MSWNLVRRNVFLSGSWDDTIKLWDMNSPASLATFKEHTYCVYAANWYVVSHQLGSLLYKKTKAHKRRVLLGEMNPNSTSRFVVQESGACRRVCQRFWRLQPEGAHAHSDNCMRALSQNSLADSRPCILLLPFLFLRDGRHCRGNVDAVGPLLCIDHVQVLLGL